MPKHSPGNLKLNSENIQLLVFYLKFSSKLTQSQVYNNL